MKKMSRFNFSNRYPGNPAPLVKKTFLSPLNAIGTFVKNCFTIYLWYYIWTQYFIPVIYMSSICHIQYLPYCLSKYSFIINIKIKYCKLSDFFFLSRLCWLSWPFTFLYSLWGQLTKFYKKPAMIFIGISLTFQINLKIIYLSTVLSLPTYKHGIFFHLCKVSQQHFVIFSVGVVIYI